MLEKCHDQELQELAMLEEVLIEFRNKFHNFRNSIKISTNLKRFKLALDGLKLTGKSVQEVFL
jgi:hypothetical protein